MSENSLGNRQKQKRPPTFREYVSLGYGAGIFALSELGFLNYHIAPNILVAPAALIPSALFGLFAIGAMGGLTRTNQEVVRDYKALRDRNPDDMAFTHTINTIFPIATGILTSVVVRDAIPSLPENIKDIAAVTVAGIPVVNSLHFQITGRRGK